MNARPSRDELRRKALLAAGTVALALTSAACIDAGKLDVTDPDGSDTPSTLADTDPADDSGDPAGSTDTAPTSSGDDTSLVDTSTLRPDCAERVGDTGLFACCDALRAWCEDAHPNDFDAQNTCTFGPNFDGSTGCIPWGPPVPPRASRRLA